MFKPYDIEVFSNCLLACFKVSGEYRHYRIGFGLDEREAILAEFTDSWIVGFNNHSYDDRIIALLRNPHSTTRDFYEMSKTLIEGNEKPYFRNPFKTIDLIKMWADLIRKSRKLSLKSLACHIKFENIIDFNFDPDLPLDELRLEECKSYNENDVAITERLLERLTPELKMKQGIALYFGLDVKHSLNRDMVNLGSDILYKAYKERYGRIEEPDMSKRSIHFRDILQTPIEPIRVGEVANAFSEVEGTTLKHDFNLTFQFDNRIYTYGTGGIHSVDKAEILESNEEYVLVAADCRSYYTNLLFATNATPKHLGQHFFDEYRRTADLRAEAKAKGDKIVNEGLKSSLVGVSGKLKDPYSWMYDPVANITMTVNGQWWLTLLIDQLYDKGFHTQSANTDGIEVWVKRDRYDEFLSICKKWEQATQLDLEYENYKIVYRRHVNSYLAVTESGKIKRKNEFEGEEKWLEKSHDELIIAIAFENYVVKGIPIAETIRNCEDPYLFCESKKCDRKFKIYHDGQLCQRMNRYYASKSGAYLYKSKPSKRKVKIKDLSTWVGSDPLFDVKGKPFIMEDYDTMEHMKSDTPVKLFNKAHDNWKQDIDFEYYINKTQELYNSML